MIFAALTAYGATIPRALTDWRMAREWIAEHGDDYPGSKIVRIGPKGRKTVWKHKEKLS